MYGVIYANPTSGALFHGSPVQERQGVNGVRRVQGHKGNEAGDLNVRRVRAGALQPG